MVNGATHEETLGSARNLAKVLEESGRAEEAARLRSEYGLADGGGDMAEMMQLLLGSLGAGAAPADLGLSGAPAVLFQLLAQAHQADDDDDDASERVA